MIFFDLNNELKKIQNKFNFTCENTDECLNKLINLFIDKIIFNDLNLSKEDKIKFFITALNTYNTDKSIVNCSINKNKLYKNPIVFNSIDELKEHYIKNFNQNPSDIDLINYTCELVVYNLNELNENNKRKIFEELHHSIHYTIIKDEIIEDELDFYYIKANENDNQSTFTSTLKLLAYVLDIDSEEEFINYIEEMESCYSFVSDEDLEIAKTIINLINEKKFNELYKTISDLIFI